jgi:hypothetical protein
VTRADNEWIHCLQRTKRAKPRLHLGIPHDVEWAIDHEIAAEQDAFAREPRPSVARVPSRQFARE